MDTAIRATIRRETIYHALKNKGAVREGTVLGIMLKNHPELKESIPSVKEEIARVADDLSRKDLAEIESLAKQEDVSYAPPSRERRGLVPIDAPSPFVTRLPPEPSKHLHVGHAISFLINVLYAERHDGEVLLRFEDTNPSLAREEYVTSIQEDITDYLGITVSSVSYSSDMIEQMYELAERLITQGDAYVCSCAGERMRELRRRGEVCEHRQEPVEAHLTAWKEMIAHSRTQGSCVLRLAADMQSTNMVMRDPVLFRISYEPHYRHHTRFCVWPLYDFENAVMDGLEGVTVVLRSNEFGTMRGELQRHIRRSLDLPEPRVYEYGRFEIVGADTRGRVIRERIASGEYLGWDDPRLATLKAMRRRGFAAETFREIAREVGLSPTPTRIDEKMLAKYNRRIVDPHARRFSFVYDPREIVIENYPLREAKLRVHPDREERERVFRLDGRFLIRAEDADLAYFRLMDAGNIRRENGYHFDSQSLEECKAQGGVIINWLPADESEHLPAQVRMPDARCIEGRIERGILSCQPGEIVQLERFGFCRVDSVENGQMSLWFAHK